jgi:hypothetical protein
MIAKEDANSIQKSSVTGFQSGTTRSNQLDRINVAVSNIGLQIKKLAGKDQGK